MFLLLVVTVLGCSIGARSIPVPDSGPHLANDWGQPVRHRHLYATRRGLHLQINTNGKITGSHVQSLHSKWSLQSSDWCRALITFILAWTHFRLLIIHSNIFHTSWCFIILCSLHYPLAWLVPKWTSCAFSICSPRVITFPSLYSNSKLNTAIFESSWSLLGLF